MATAAISAPADFTARCTGAKAITLRGVREQNRTEEKEKRGTRKARRPAPEISQDAWLTWLQKQCPDIDVRAELVKALKRKPDLERLWFAEHWLPNCSAKVIPLHATNQDTAGSDALVYGADPEGWREWLTLRFPQAAFSDWQNVPLDVRQKFASERLKTA